MPEVLYTNPADGKNYLLVTDIYGAPMNYHYNESGDIVMNTGVEPFPGWTTDEGEFIFPDGLDLISPPSATPEPIEQPSGDPAPLAPGDIPVEPKKRRGRPRKLEQ